MLDNPANAFYHDQFPAVPDPGIKGQYTTIFQAPGKDFTIADTSGVMKTLRKGAVFAPYVHKEIFRYLMQDDTVTKIMTLQHIYCPTYLPAADIIIPAGVFLDGTYNATDCPWCPYLDPTGPAVVFQDFLVPAGTTTSDLSNFVLGGFAKYSVTYIPRISQLLILPYSAAYYGHIVPTASRYVPNTENFAGITGRPFIRQPMAYLLGGDTAPVFFPLMDVSFEYDVDGDITFIRSTAFSNVPILFSGVCFQTDNFTNAVLDSEVFTISTGVRIQATSIGSGLSSPAITQIPGP